MKTNNIGNVPTSGTWFRFGGCARQPEFAIDVVDPPADLSAGDPLRPQGTDLEGTLFRITSVNGPLFLPTLLLGNTAGAVALGRTSGTAFVVTSHQDSRFTGQLSPALTPASARPSR